MRKNRRERLRPNSQQSRTSQKDKQPQVETLERLTFQLGVTEGFRLIQGETPSVMREWLLRRKARLEAKIAELRASP